MKRILLKRKMQACYLHGGILTLVVCLLLASVDLAQSADTRIAFVSQRLDDRNAEIFLMNFDGKRVRRLTEHPQFDAAPAWSPDGQKITFMSFRDEPSDLYIMNSDGTNLINLTQSPEAKEASPSWSPNGKQIAYRSWGIFNANGFFQSDIWMIDADGANQHNLTNHIASDHDPDWSPDGLQIAFYSDRDKAWEFDTWDNRDVYVMNADGTHPINLTNHPADDRHPDWSPDGLQIAFSSDRNGNSEIYVMNADGTNPINLTNHPADDRHPDWSPDGIRIAFSTNRDGDWEKKPNDNWEVYVMNADGTKPINLTNHPAWDSSPSWEPTPTFSVAPKGRLATLWGSVKRTNTYNGR